MVDGFRGSVLEHGPGFILFWQLLTVHWNPLCTVNDSGQICFALKEAIFKADRGPDKRDEKFDVTRHLIFHSWFLFIQWLDSKYLLALILLCEIQWYGDLFNSIILRNIGSAIIGLLCVISFGLLFQTIPLIRYRLHWHLFHQRCTQ